MLNSRDMQTDIKMLFDAGAHFGYARARRHPSAAAFIFGTKDRTDIFDLEETMRRLEAARAFASSVSAGGKQLLFLSGKNEAMSIIKDIAARAGAPFVAGRWIGGTFTNFKNIRKRIDRLEKLISERDRGELEKYTKKERLLIDREIAELLVRFGGLTNMLELPGAIFVVDPKRENTAVREANQMNVPVIALASSDCDFSSVQYPIPGSDTSVRNIRLVAEAITEGYEEGKNTRVTK